MKCKAVTRDRSRQFLRAAAHPCQWEAKRDGFCAVHHPDVMRPILIRRIGGLEAELESLRGELAAFDAPAWPGNPS